MTNVGTYFYDTEGNRLAIEDGILPIPLFKGMKITFSGNSSEFHVVEWSFHHGHRLEEGGLRILLRHAEERNGQDLSHRGPNAGHESQ
jgi:hypothetical protein